MEYFKFFMTDDARCNYASIIKSCKTKSDAGHLIVGMIDFITTGIEPEIPPKIYDKWIAIRCGLKISKIQSESKLNQESIKNESKMNQKSNENETKVNQKSNQTPIDNQQVKQNLCTLSSPVDRKIDKIDKIEEIDKIEKEEKRNKKKVITELESSVESIENLYGALLEIYEHRGDNIVFDDRYYDYVKNKLGQDKDEVDGYLNRLSEAKKIYLTRDLKENNWHIKITKPPMLSDEKYYQYKDAIANIPNWWTNEERNSDTFKQLESYGFIECLGNGKNPINWEMAIQNKRVKTSLLQSVPKDIKEMERLYTSYYKFLSTVDDRMKKYNTVNQYSLCVTTNY